MSRNHWSDDELVDEVVEIDADDEVELTPWEVDFVDYLITAPKDRSSSVSLSERQRRKCREIIQKYRD